MSEDLGQKGRDMMSSRLIRWAGLAAMVGGVVYAGFVLLAETYWIESLNYVNTIGYGFVAVLQPLGAMAAIAALHALQRQRYGMLGTYFSTIAFVDLALAVGALTAGVAALSYPSGLLVLLILVGLLAASIGMALLGGLTMTVRVLPWWCGAALAAGSPFGMLLMMVPSMVFPGTPGGALAGGSLCGTGRSGLGVGRIRNLSGDRV